LSLFLSFLRLAALAAVPTAHLAFQYVGVRVDESGSIPAASNDDDSGNAALHAFEAAPSPAIRTAVVALELGRLVAGVVGGGADDWSPLFSCEPLAHDLAAAVCASMTGGCSGGAALSALPLPPAAAAALVRQGEAGPALAASVAVNVPGALEGVCGALAGLLNGDARAASASKLALLAVAETAPPAAAAVAAAALARGSPAVALAATLTHPGAAVDLVRRTAFGGPPTARAALATALTTPQPAFTAAWAGTLAGRAGAPWTATDTADLRATAILLGAGAAPVRGVGAAWAARLRGGEPKQTGPTTPPPLLLIPDADARLAGTAAALLLAPVLAPSDMRALIGAVTGGGDGPALPPPCAATGVWVASHLLARRWGALAAGLRAGLAAVGRGGGGGAAAAPVTVTVRFPDAALDAAAAAAACELAGTDRPDWEAAVEAAGRAAAGLAWGGCLAGGAPASAARALEAVDAALSAGVGRLSPPTLAALGAAAAAHLAAAGLPLHPSASALAFTAAGAAARAGVDLLPAAVLEQCLSDPALRAAERGGADGNTPAGAPALASLYLLERAALDKLPPGVWPPPLEAALPVRRLACIVADPAKGCASIRARWLALAADIAPAAVAAALGDGGGGGGGMSGSDPAFEGAAAAASPAGRATAPTCPATAALALRMARRSGAAGRASPADADATAAAALPLLLRPACPPACADELARWLAVLAPGAARRACARVLLVLGCGGSDHGISISISRKRSAGVAGLDGEEAAAAAPTSASVDAFAADLVAAPLLALAPRSATWDSPPLARAVLAAALRTLEDARRAARALSSAAASGEAAALPAASGQPPAAPPPGSSVLAPPPPPGSLGSTGTPGGHQPSAHAPLLPTGRELEAALTAQDGAAALLMVEALDGAWGQAEAQGGGAAAAATAAAAAETASAIADALHSLFLVCPGAARVLHWQGYPPRLAGLLVSAVPSAHIAAGWVAGLVGTPGAGGLGPALAGALAATYPTPASLGGVQAALARGRAAVATGDTATVVAALAAGARSVEALPGLAGAVCHLAQSAADASGGGRTDHASSLLAGAAAAAVGEVVRAWVGPGGV